jgi:undecaprenyl-diphosphatase
MNTTVPEQHRPQAIRTLRWVSVSVLGVALFSILAVALIYAGPSDAWDLAISRAVQSFRNPVLDAVMITATYLCSWQVVIIGGVLAAVYLLLQRLWFGTVALVASLLGNVLIVGSLKDLLHRVRPDQSLALVPASGSSFPSGHTFSAFAFYGLLAVLYVGQGRRAGHQVRILTIAAVLVVAVGLSRIYVGAHWPSDVLGSIFLGSAWIALIGLTLASLRTQNPVAPSQTSDRWARRWAVVIVLIWAISIVGYAAVHSPVQDLGALA